ncbi:MAG: DUF2807 domain-containing protein [Lewinellaceae bacterium]|nr:DUF2807 domain-containing protein [Lewinellaceae bacterium]
MKLLILLPMVLLSWITILQGQTLQETRVLDNFDRINITGGVDQITLVQGDKPGVQIEANGVSSDKILTMVKGRDLNVSVKTGWRGNKVRMIITYRNLDVINNSGSNNVAFESVLKGNEFIFNNSGSGNFTAEVALEKITINMSGSGACKLRGNAEKQFFAISGSSNINATALKGESAKVSIVGSGNVDLNVSGEVNQTISGSGKVRNTSSQ